MQRDKLRLFARTKNASEKRLINNTNTNVLYNPWGRVKHTDTKTPTSPTSTLLEPLVTPLLRKHNAPLWCSHTQRIHELAAQLFIYFPDILPCTVHMLCQNKPHPRINQQFCWEKTINMPNLLPHVRCKRKTATTSSNEQSKYGIPKKKWLHLLQGGLHDDEPNRSTNQVSNCYSLQD